MKYAQCLPMSYTQEQVVSCQVYSVRPSNRNTLTSMTHMCLNPEAEQRKPLEYKPPQCSFDAHKGRDAAALVKMVIFFSVE